MHVAGGWGLLITSTAVSEKLFLFTSTCESSNSLLTCCESTFDYAIMKRPELHSSILVTTQAGKYDFSTGFLFFSLLKILMREKWKPDWLVLHNLQKVT